MGGVNYADSGGQELALTGWHIALASWIISNHKRSSKIRDQ